jgi:hypothetical protein
MGDRSGLGAARTSAHGAGIGERRLDLGALGLAIALGVTGSLSVFVVLSWYRVPVAAWLVLTLYVLAMAPSPTGTTAALVAKAAQRVLGTVVGVAAAASPVRLSRQSRWCSCALCSSEGWCDVMTPGVGAVTSPRMADGCSTITQLFLVGRQVNGEE